MGKNCFIFGCLLISLVHGIPIKGPISNLIHIYHHCLTSDVDDDGFVEYGDARHTALRADIDRDGGISKDEVARDPVLKEITEEDFHVYDTNGDGLLSLSELTDIFFLQTGELGDNRDMPKCLEFLTKEEKDVVTGYEISIKTFVITERNFNLIDIDDDGLVSEDEYQAEYRVADYNQDNTLTDLEIKLFRPTFLISIDGYCSDTSVGCLLDDFLPIFNEADENNDGRLDLKEYVTRFGKDVDTE